MTERDAHPDALAGDGGTGLNLPDAVADARKHQALADFNRARRAVQALLVREHLCSSNAEWSDRVDCQSCVEKSVGQCVRETRRRGHKSNKDRHEREMRTSNGTPASFSSLRSSKSSSLVSSNLFGSALSIT